MLLTEGRNGDISGYIHQADIFRYILNEYFVGNDNTVLSKVHINKKYFKIIFSPCILIIIIIIVNSYSNPISFIITI